VLRAALDTGMVVEQEQKEGQHTLVLYASFFEADDVLHNNKPRLKLQEYK
jgi:hypothetical protein